MTSETWASAFVGAALWAVFLVGASGGFKLGPSDEAWVATSSDKVASHPTLVRVALPVKVAAAH